MAGQGGVLDHIALALFENPSSMTDPLNSSDPSSQTANGQHRQILGDPLWRYAVLAVQLLAAVIATDHGPVVNIAITIVTP